MPVIPTTEDELKTAADFTRVCNEWFRELVSIEENLLTKAEQVQVLQNSHDSEPDRLKGSNEDLVLTQIEQIYEEGSLNRLVKEHEEIQREISKLEESLFQPKRANATNYEECSALFESVDVQLKTVKDNFENLLERINHANSSTSNESPLPDPEYCTILDRYVRALQVLNSNTTEIQQRFSKLREMYLQSNIPSDMVVSPL